jgi:hypothetical protein
MTPGSEREAFLLWTSSSEKGEKERVAIRKEAIAKLEGAIEGSGRDAPRRSLLTSTLRRWKGLVEREEGNWTSARFEFLQGRSLAESYDQGNVPWFDAAVTEAEIWQAFGKPGLDLGSLTDLVEKLDSTAGLYGMAGDRLSEELSSEWAEWFRFFLTPTVPRRELVASILHEVERFQGRLGSGGAATRTPLGGYVFQWSFFWYSALARRTEVLLTGVLGTAPRLEGLLRGAALLAAPTVSFEPLLRPSTFRGTDSPLPASPEQLEALIRSDLEAFHAIDEGTAEYVSRVRSLWDTAAHQKRKEVEHAMHPGKQRR